MHLLLVGLARGLQNRVIRVRVLSDAPVICSYRLMEKLSGYGPDVEGSSPPGSTICTSTEIGYNGADLKSDVPVRACGFESYLVRQ